MFLLCVWAVFCEKMNLFKFTFNEVFDQSKLCNCTLFRCQRWLSRREVNHDVRRHILSLLLKDEGRICAGKKSWKGLLKRSLWNISHWLILFRNAHISMMIGGHNWNIIMILFLLYCGVNFKNGVKLPFETLSHCWIFLKLVGSSFACAILNLATKIEDAIKFKKLW